jgi:hypothetical protein
MTSFKPFAAIIAFVSIMASPTMALAEDLLSITKADVKIELTEEDVAKLPQTSFETSTIWTEGKIEFSGPTLKSVLALADITEGEVTLTAINDYAVKIDVADITDTAPIIANLMNGETFSRREKGPYWVVFPYDSDAKYQQEEIYAVSIWQLTSIEETLD